MSHFKYEINERNLKLQLKENKLAFSEEAWQKFESFTETHKGRHHEDAMKRFNISLNRNVVLPLVFGAIIVLFSLLLFNFVNIKNPSHQTVDVQTPANITPASIKKEIPPQKKEPVPAAAKKDSVSITAVKAEIKNTEDDKIPAENPANEINSQAEAARAVVPEPKIAITPAKTEDHLVSDQVNPPAQTEAPPKKKHKKRQLIITEPTAEEDNQLPPPVSQASSDQE